MEINSEENTYQPRSTYPDYPDNSNKDDKITNTFNQNIKGYLQVILAAFIGGCACGAANAYKKKYMLPPPIVKPTKKKKKEEVSHTNMTINEEIKKTPEEKRQEEVKQNSDPETDIFLPTTEQTNEIIEMIDLLSSNWYLLHLPTLTSLGNKIDAHIKPFPFLATILLSEEGKEKLKTIITEGMINKIRREKFLTGFSEGIEKKHEDPTDDFEKFCIEICPQNEEIKTFQAKLQPYFDTKNWEEFMNEAIKLI